MERVVLDTSVLIAVERGAVDLAAYIHEDDDAALAAVTVAELLVGVERAGEAQRARRATIVEELIAQVDCLPYDLPAARAHAELMAHVAALGQPRGVHDLIIAATARAHGRTVVTLDRRGFEGLPGVNVRGG
jgi:tRNA(fMet)-specific endonuclease VapC